MTFLQGKVAVVTGAGQGLGREEALALADAGAIVVVNDIGNAPEPDGERPAQAVAREVREAGGTAEANLDDISTWSGAEKLIDQAFAITGRLDILVCNAGIVRDRMLYKMSEAEWDAVIRVHLNGHYFPTRFAAERWRAQAKETGAVGARVIYTTSEAGLFGHVGQVNYAAAKAGVTGMCFTAAQELARIGVTVNTVSPRGRTPMTFGAFGEIAIPKGGFDVWDPANVAPMVVFLARDEAAEISGQVFVVHGGTVSRLAGWQELASIKIDHRWGPEELHSAVATSLVPQLKAAPPEFPVEIG
ncbi:SDR family NAD(P)-dependent oxidoreductase [Nocardia sp. R6R-6]|uniref:SDR family NAD(P)-dependent oxidoreductase n=1 Tax=Nocardia sp. R6R-6 TaxID=3459303 RepID=UPI00403D74D1